MQKILIVDDNKDLCEFVGKAARLYGWQCTTTVTADFLECLTPDTSLILLDLMLPEMDGIELLRLLGKQHCNAGIVLMSGVSKRVLQTADELAQALGLFIVGSLQKPFQMAELEEMLARPHQPPAVPLTAAKPQVKIWDIDLKLAIEHNEFVLHYQPQIEIATGRIVGLEALVRWKRPDGNLIFPDNFIGRLEAMGHIDELGWLVIERAFAETAQFADEHGEVPAISVNASVSSLLDLAFPDTLMIWARQFAVPAEKIRI